MITIFFHTDFYVSSTCRILQRSIRKCSSWMVVLSVEFCRIRTTTMLQNIHFGDRIYCSPTKKLLLMVTKIISKVMFAIVNKNPFTIHKLQFGVFFYYYSEIVFRACKMNQYSWSGISDHKHIPGQYRRLSEILELKLWSELSVD